MSNHLTLHIITSTPYSNLNRDDTGTPKRIMQGGTMRAVHSSQSIKRGIRLNYQERTTTDSIRSAYIANLVLDRANEINPDLDPKEAKKTVGKLIKGLTSKEAYNDEDKDNRSIFVSTEEIEAMAATVANNTEKSVNDVFHGHKTGALAIAAFGRMFAANPDLNTEAAIAVSPGVTTHTANIATDYFTAVDDTAATTFLGVNQFTSGIFYRTITIDRKQLKDSWTGYTSPNAHEQVSALVESMFYGQPNGKVNSTAPYTMPSLIIAEEQNHRIAYDFDTPVQPDDNGGYLNPTISNLARQVEAAHKFDPDNFAGIFAVSGTHPDINDLFSQEITPKNNIIGQITDWALKAE